MPSYENDNCPVCCKKFTSEDDIVTCPYCGTPHHRECYNSLGHCFNEEKHGGDFSFKPAVSAESSDKDDTMYDFSRLNKNTEYYQPENEKSQQQAESPANNAENKTSNSNTDNGSNGPQTPFGGQVRIGSPLTTGYENSSETIEGKSVSDVADVVRTNTKKFIPKFIANKKCSWNWGGFFFGPYYLFFRRMNKEGTLFLAIRLIISLIVQGIFAEPYAKFFSFLSSNYETLTSNPTESLLDELMAVYQPVLPMFIILLAANLVISVVIALCADRLYRSKVLKLLSDVDVRMLDNDLAVQPFMTTDGGSNISAKDMKKLYLGRLGGTSILNPITAFCIYDIITSIISSL